MFTLLYSSYSSFATTIVSSFNFNSLYALSSSLLLASLISDFLSWAFCKQNQHILVLTYIMLGNKPTPRWRWVDNEFVLVSCSLITLRELCLLREYTLEVVCGERWLWSPAILWGNSTGKRSNINLWFHSLLLPFVEIFLVRVIE